MKALGQATKGRTSICIAHRYVLSFNTHSFKQKKVKAHFSKRSFCPVKVKKAQPKVEIFQMCKTEIPLNFLDLTV